MRVGTSVGVLLISLGALQGTAQAELSEAAVGVEGGLVMPAFESQDSTAFRLITWGAGGFGRYGILDDLDLELRVGFSLFRAAANEQRTLQGRALDGVRYFRAEQYSVAVGARYKLISGYNLAPYIEGHVGAQWMVLREQQFLSPTGEDYGIAVPDEGQGGLTATVGLAVDYRLFDLGFVGVAARWVEVFGHGLHQRYLTVPVEVVFYW